jgi:hypothetical protein
MVRGVPRRVHPHREIVITRKSTFAAPVIIIMPRSSLLLLACPLLGSSALVTSSGCLASHPSSALRTSLLHMRATSLARSALVNSFVEATERGDAAAAMELCTDDLLYKTHSATTESLLAAQERLHTKVPKPSKVTKGLREEGCTVHDEDASSFESCVLVRDIVVKPIPFVTVSVRQEFEVRDHDDGGVRLCRAEYIKQ